MSDWGRKTPERSGRRRNWLPLFLLSLVCIAVGAAGYYFLDRGGYLSSQYQSREREIGDLVAERDAIAAEAERLRARAGADSATSENLEKTRLRLGEVEQHLEERTQELARLQESLKLAETINGHLQSRLDLAEKVTTELEAQLAGQADRIESGIRDGQDEMDTLRQTLAARDDLIRQYNEESERLSKVEAELETARDELSAQRQEVARLDEADAEIGRMQAELDAARKALEQRTADSVQRPEPPQPDNTASRVIADLEGRLAAAEAEQLADKKRYEELETASADMVAALKKELAAARARITGLEAELDRQAANVAQSGSGDPAPAQAPTPRDPLAVADAMRRAAGLGTIEVAQRDRIATRLIEGECVSTILQDEFGRAPAPTLRDLISALDSVC
jgi:DNA repair exonuclease SbcCD ATPase subunit